MGAGIICWIQIVRWVSRLLLDDLLSDLIGFPVSLFNSILISPFRSIPAPGSRWEVLRLLDGFNTLLFGGVVSLVTKMGMKLHDGNDGLMT